MEKAMNSVVGELKNMEELEASRLLVENRKRRIYKIDRSKKLKMKFSQGQLTRFLYYHPEVSSMKYCCLGVFRKEYGRHVTKLGK